MLSMSPSKRRDTDMMKLMMSDFEVHIPDESSMHDFLVAFPGPKDTPYEGGTWKVHVTLPNEYPFKSPSIGFENRIFHPNVDEMSGSVCLDVINQTWSPMFDLVNIFKMFIPQLLLYPNPTDPLNGEAAALLMRDPDAYAKRIKEYVRLHASDLVNLDGTPVVPRLPTSSTSSPLLATPSSGGSSSGDGSGRATSTRRPTETASSNEVNQSNDLGVQLSDPSLVAPTSSSNNDQSSNDEGGLSSLGVTEDSMLVVEEEDKSKSENRRKISSAGTNSGAGSSSCSSEYMMEMDIDETVSDVSVLSDVET